MIRIKDLLWPLLTTCAVLACDNGDSSGSGTTTPDGGTFTPPPETPPTTPPGQVLTPCPAVTGTGTTHNKEVTADETWTAAGSPHNVTFGVRFLATVTIEPCATVLLGDGYSITLGDPGKPGALVAKGEKGVDASGAPLRRAVTFAAADPTKAWGGIYVTADGKLDLTSAILTDAANTNSEQNGGGAIVAYGKTLASGVVTKNVRVVDVTIDKSRGNGLNFTSMSGFTDDSKDVVVTNGGRAATYPVRLETGAVGTMPNVTFTGNVANEAQIVGNGVAMLDDTFHDRGVPYRVSGRIRVAPDVDGPTRKLTIEPGVTLRFDTDAAGSGIDVGSSNVRMGLLVAEGTAAKPITFTSAKATPAAGDWANIYFSYTPSTGNKITNAVVEYAGSPSGAQGYGCGPIENDSSILILSGRPDAAFIQNTTLRNGGGDTGILLGWSSDATGPDFVATNTFTNMPACHVSRWKNATGTACPGSVGGSPVCF